jgi:hypothetical protein
MSERRADETETRQERREERLRRKREKMPQHGRGLGRVYKEAILKRIRHLRDEKQKQRGE